jgi:hypothetical protein
MAAIIRENKVYFASSLIGGAYIYIPQDTSKSQKMKYMPGVIDQAKVPWTLILNRALVACQIGSLPASVPVHRTGANCGKPMAALVCARNQGWYETLEGAVVVTWGKTGKDQMEMTCSA